MCPITSQAMTLANPIPQKSGSRGNTPSPARVAADNGVTISPARAEDCAEGASIGVAVRTALAAVAPPPTDSLELDKLIDRGEAAADAGSAANSRSFADGRAVDKARGKTGTFQFGDTHIPSGSSALLTSVA